MNNSRIPLVEVTVVPKLNQGTIRNQDVIDFGAIFLRKSSFTFTHFGQISNAALAVKKSTNNNYLIHLFI
jgi:hypothetical protein